MVSGMISPVERRSDPANVGAQRRGGATCRYVGGGWRLRRGYGAGRPSAVLAAVLGFAAVALSAGCAGGRPAGEHEHVSHAPATACAAAPVDGSGATVARTVAWLDHSSPDDRIELDHWCLGVGVPVVVSAAGRPAQLDSVAVIAWNIHVGRADVDAFVADLRSGAMTGGPVEHFVLLLQEARRNGRRVPATLPAHARTARRLGDPAGGDRGDVVHTARRLGLGLFYVPSMRNGGRDKPAGDRGNAILTTLRLESLTAIELPLLSQRRVAVGATIPLLDAAGVTRELRVTSVHLDFRANRRHLLAPFGPGRTRQATALADATGGGSNHVVGGDFNTWSFSFLEGALDVMQARFPDFPAGHEEPTFYTAGVLPRQLDHLFLRAVDVTASAPTRVDDRYGSDHHPLISWIHLPHPQ
jgi:endonuclease/exonuclease/phosphatase family metal-dependent hydrolase